MKGVVIAGTGSGVGKTSVATGIMSRLSKRRDVQAFKAGPDFIDPMYHRAATGRPGRNLDSFMMSDDRIRNLVGYASKGSDICVIEGVRGLYEGFSGDDDLGSTAHIAKLLGLPVVLVIDASSLTRSAAAIVKGFQAFDPDVRIAGVILNKVSGEQHSGKLDVAFSTYCPDVAVLGKIRKDRDNVLDQRHLGLKTLHSYKKGEIEPLERLVDTVDLDMLEGIAEDFEHDLPSDSPYFERESGLRAAVPFDDAYSFYYRENLECLEASGISLRFFRPTDGEPLPDADIAYLGGGYPELYADRISENTDFLEGLRSMSSEGRPVLGECGGLMTMCSDMKDKHGDVHRMAGIFDARADFVNRRHGPTYVIEEALPNNPLFGGIVRGHEYHYSEIAPSKAEYCFSMKRGLGIADGMDGLVSGNSVGTYMHQHSLSMRDWAGGLVDAVCGARRRGARSFRASVTHGVFLDIIKNTRTYTRMMGRADTHVHTEYSGFQKLGVIKFPESVASPEMQVDKARSNGMDVVCITDHDETHGAFLAEKYARSKYDDIEVVPGEEVTTADGEIIGLFLSERVPDMLSVEETIEIIREQGGLAIAPHPFSFHVPGLKERILDIDIDGFEVINGGHPDGYTNMFARLVMDRYPGRWCETSGSDAHSVFTTGYNWTEYPGCGAEDFRKAVLKKTTKACGTPAPVFGQVQWSVDVVIGGQKLMLKSLQGRLRNVPKDHLIEKINSISDLKKATGIFAGMLYVIPPISFLATILSVSYLNKGSAKMCSKIPERMELIDAIINEVDANGGPGHFRPAYLDAVTDNPLSEYQGLPFDLPFKMGRMKR